MIDASPARQARAGNEAQICRHGWTVSLFDLRSRAKIQWLLRTRSDLP
jgi:hypothetical protein